MYLFKGLCLWLHVNMHLYPKKPIKILATFSKPHVFFFPSLTKSAFFIFQAAKLNLYGCGAVGCKLLRSQKSVLGWICMFPLNAKLCLRGGRVWALNPGRYSERGGPGDGRDPGLTDCRIMETQVSLAQESNAQIAQSCLGIERNTFHHSRFHVGDGCDPAEGEDFTANTRGGTINMYRLMVQPIAQEVNLNPTQAEAHAEDGPSAFHLPFIHYT